MARRRPQLGFEAISIEGGLLTSDFLAQVAELQAGRQAPEDYRVPRGLQIRDEIGRAWRIAEAHWRDVSLPGAQQEGRERALLALLREAFGWNSLERLAHAIEIDERTYPLTAAAIDGHVPVVIARPDIDLDGADLHFGDGTKRRSPFGLVQEFLNANDHATWGVVTNGVSLRLVRDNASLTRPAWIEMDLARIFSEQRYADFSLLWLVLHESRFGSAVAPSHEAILEQWRSKSVEAGTAARDRLRDGVEAAVRALGNGFLSHAANSALRDRLTIGAMDAAGYQQQLLRLVYRMIFLLVGEERELLHPVGSDAGAIRTYRDGYALQRLRARAVRRRSYDRHDDVWDALLTTIRGCASGEPLLALPGLGGLFAASQCPDLDAARLPNRALLDAVFRLTWLTDDNALTRVNWRDMGTEELGSVYESLLELVPEVHDSARRFGFVGDPVLGHEGEAAAGTQGNARKLTGSYYTPDSLVQALLESTLDPIIERALTANNPERALLALTILDPAMGSGHFLLGASRRVAAQLARVRSDGTPGPQAFRSALREVISHCVYGVDKNAMAVELARIALWLEAMEPGKPLAFLDHHLVHGDAILGIHDPAVLGEGIPDDAYSALTGDDKETAKALKKTNAAARKRLTEERAAGQFLLVFDQDELTRQLGSVEAMPDGTLAEIAAKKAALAAARTHEDAKFHFACDAYVAAFLLRKDAHTRDVVPTSGTLRNLSVGMMPSAEMRAAVARVAAQVPFLHWPITFAPVMSRGGFDCVVGNPPWEKITLSEKEFFSSRDSAIAHAQNKAARQRLIDELEQAPAGTPTCRLFEAFEHAKQEAEGASRYARQGGRFPLTGSGDVNLYALFAEVALAVINEDGMAGMLLPSGITADAGTAAFYRHIAAGRLRRIVSYENEEMLLVGVHHAFKFLFVTIAKRQSNAATEMAFFLRKTTDLADERRRFTLSAEDLRRLNPNTGTAPIFRSKADAELTVKIYRNVPVLWDETREDGNPWGLSFGTMFHMSNDSGLFRTAPGEGLVPLYEAKMIQQYDHRSGSFEARGDERGYRVLPETAMESYQDPEYTVSPFYWVKRSEVENRLQGTVARNWLLAFKDVTAPTNERTVIAAIIPRVGVGHTAPLIINGSPVMGGTAIAASLLLATINSLVFDYVARQKISGLHLTYTYFRQLPVPSPERWPAATIREIVARVFTLTFTSKHLRGYGADMISEVAATWPGDIIDNPVQTALWDPINRATLRAEIDATIANAFGLNRDDLAFILDPADTLGADYPTETFRVLKEGELANYGEFRTKRLVLEAWDRLIGTR